MNSHKKKLSKNLLQMKFMKRTKEKQDIEDENEERRTIFRNEISDAMRSEGQRVIIEPSFAAVEDLLFGRLAFKGMNPEIEKMMDNDRIREEEAAAMRAEKSIDDQEMAAAYGNLNETMARKFGGKKRQHQQIAGGSSTSSAMMASTSSGVGNSKQLLSDVSSFLKSARSGGASVASEGTNPGELKRPKQEFLKPKDDF